MRNLKKITIVVIIAAIVILGGFDVVIAYLGGKESTISLVITDYSHKWPVIPFAFGFLMGHFFAQDN